MSERSAPSSVFDPEAQDEKSHLMHRIQSTRPEFAIEDQEDSCSRMFACLWLSPFVSVQGAISEKDGIIVELHASGLVGYGESSPMAGSFYSCDTPETSWTELCEVVAPAVLGCEFEGPADWNHTLDGLLAGNFTKAGVETAFWDLTGKREEQTASHLAGRYKAQGGIRACGRSL